MSSLSSTQVTWHGSSASARTIAAPTWPAPNNIRCGRYARQESSSQRWPELSNVIWQASPVSICENRCKPGPAKRVPAAPHKVGAVTVSSETRRQVSCPLRQRWLRQFRYSSALGGIRSNARCTTPPQHWPRLGPSGKRSRRRSAARESSGIANISRAISAARISRCPPPMVSNIWSCVTTIFAPGSRGPEPTTLATVTSTLGTACVARALSQ